MRLYPQLPTPRNRQIMADLSVGACLILFAAFAWGVRAAVLTLRIITTGMTTVTEGVHSGWVSVADALDAVPLLGGSLSGLLRDLADGTIGNVSDVGHDITNAITLTANVLGLATFAVPTALIAAFWLPLRIRRAQRWEAAAAVLGAQRQVLLPGGAGAPGGDGPIPAPTLLLSAPPLHLVALRALCQLPLEDLVKFEPRPFEAYAQGRYDRLAAALYACEGVQRA
ncbi:MAG: hypothetical protein ACOYEV_03480 [Candidatus Nanopelagicales bacterium]